MTTDFTNDSSFSPPLREQADASISAEGGCGPLHPRRLGQVIELRPESMELYTRVHADDHAGVRDLLAKHGLHNFSIYLQVRRGIRSWTEAAAGTLHPASMRP